MIVINELPYYSVTEQYYIGDTVIYLDEIYTFTGNRFKCAYPGIEPTDINFWFPRGRIEVKNERK